MSGRDLNQRAGLRPGELSRRYRRHLEQERASDVVEENDPWLYYGGDAEAAYYDEHWVCCGSYTEQDFVVFQVIETFMLHRAMRPTIADVLPDELRPVAPPAEPPPRRISADELPQQLFEHVARFVPHYPVRGGGVEQIVDQLVRNADIRGLFERFRRRPAPLLMVALFAPFWIRPLEEFVPPDNEADLHAALARHLFELYPVAASLYQPWRDDRTPTLKWVCWLILLGQGASLQRAAALFGWCIAPRFLHHLAAAPPELSIVDACMSAELARLGGTRVELDRLRRNPAYVIDPTDTSRAPASHRWPSDEPHEERSDRTAAFWRETAGWLIRHRDALDDETAAVVLRWGMHRHTEDLRRAPTDPTAPFTWSHRSPAAAIEAARRYEADLALPYDNVSWRGRGWDLQADERTTEGEPAWEIRELTAGRELFEESVAMHHCVRSYAYRCVRSESAIFSLRIGGRRCVTIELFPLTRVLAQARGAYNRAATSAELALITRWLATLPPLASGPHVLPGS